MDLPGVSIADEGETGMFSLRTIRGHQVRQGWHRLRRREDSFGHLEGGEDRIFLNVLHDHGKWFLSLPKSMYMTQ